MSRILTVADIHLHDYSQRNPTDKYRLYQGLTVADNIVEVGKREGCDIIVLAGDILDNYLNRPYVLAVVKEFLDRVMAGFRIGYVIWGNHDQDNKGVKSEFNDCCLSVMLPSNLYYADQKETFIDGKRIGFSNWRPEFDLSWIKGKLDILFTHATISYNQGDNYTSQVLDESKFDLAVCGDIHRAASLGKYRSVGVAQKCKMGDSDDPTGFIIDLPTMQTEWVDLDPHKKLMRFQYSDIREKEGWDDAAGVWTVYKPSNHQVAGGVKDIEIPEWKEIENLIDQAIVGNNLKGVHTEVLADIKDIDSHEVDFNFTLTGLRIKHWRSIESFEQYFAEGDKILVLGENGSGKSSYLSAIKYALTANQHYKDFIQFGSKDCRVEVDFIYQGKNYTITRGSKLYGLKVEGVDQKYNNKREFEADMLVRFPFLEYMDVYFFNSDHPRLIGDLAPERISEVISKFYKLNRLETYHDHAEQILGRIMSGGASLQEEKSKNEELLSYIESKLSYINVPTKPKEQLLAERAEGLEIQRKWQLWNDWIGKNSTLNARQEELRRRITELRVITASYNSQADKIQELRNKQSWITEKVRRVDWVIGEGTRLKKAYEDLGRQKTCRLCGHLIEPGEGLEKHKEEISNQMLGLRNQLTTLYKELWEGGVKEKSDLTNGCRETLGSIQSNLMSLSNQEAVWNNQVQELKRAENDLVGVQRSIESLGSAPEKVELPEGYYEILASIESDLGRWSSWEVLVQDKTKAQGIIERCNTELGNLQNKAKEYETYIKLTGPTGMILKEVMEKLAAQFTDNQVTYEVSQYTFRSKEHLSLGAYFNLGQNRVAYQNCSDGQRTLLDIDFLSKVVTRVGLLVMDEFLKHLDASNHDIVIDKIGQMNVGCTIISSHMESIAAFNNKKLLLKLNDSGITNIETS